MKLVTFSVTGQERVGALLDGEQLLDLDRAHRCLHARSDSPFASMIGLIEGAEAALEAAQRAIDAIPGEAVVPMSSAVLRAPLPRPPRLRDTTMFLRHMENGLLRWARNLAAAAPDPEAELESLLKSDKFKLHPVFREQVIYYNADHLAISGPDAEIVWPAASRYADYELEWACVIGAASRGIAPAEARQAIFGYTIFNDWSARDLQLRFMEANLGPAGGKDFAGSNTLGPCIVTRDEIPNPYALQMQARVNGELWSQGSTATMQHSFEDAIVQFSRFETLAVGEVIGSGTVASGCGFELGRRLQDGDVVELRVEGIGELRNRVRVASGV